MTSTAARAWQSKFFHLIFGATARQGYFAAADQALISTSNFLATVIVARYTTLTDLGVYAVGFSALTFVRNTLEGLMIQPLNVFGAAMTDEEFAGYASSTAVIQLTLAMLTALISAGGGWLLSRSGNDVAGAALFSLWFVLSFWQLQEYARRLLYTRRRVLAALLNTLLGSFIRLGLLCWWGKEASLRSLRRFACRLVGKSAHLAVAWLNPWSNLAT
jgi:hypothetical protein